ncbi:MAG: PD40 domain-containing protein [Gemmatimonadetes bacterium]|nr:PD40 domain-containing protein [Gemmatimonadota bacterium]
MRTPIRLAGWALAFGSPLVGCSSDDGVVDPGAAKHGATASIASSRFSEWSAPENLGPTVNSPFVDFTPEISRDGLSLYFSSNRPGGFGLTDLWVSRRSSVDDPWGAPVNLGPTINTSGTEGAPHLSRDGHQLFFASSRPGGFGSNDIWVSRRSDPRDDFGWEPPANLGPQVNSSEFDAGPTVRHPELYFTSDRASPGGGLDVYLSLVGPGLNVVAPGAAFGPAVLVAELSSTGNDLRPSLRFDGLEIFLSSNRAGTVGADDIWVSTRRSDAEAWSTPINVGTPINSEFVEAQPAISADGTELYFASNRPGGSGGPDLYVARRVLNPR